MIQINMSPGELIKKRLSRRGYDIDESQNVLKRRSGNLIYLKKMSNLRQSNVRDFKRFY